MLTLPQMRSKHLLPFAAYLRQHGEPVRRLVRIAGLPSACLDHPVVFLSPRMTGFVAKPLF